MDDEQRIKSTYRALRPDLNERTTRLFAAAEARNLGRGGITIVERATGIERHVITRGLKELKDKKSHPDSGAIRRRGGGRKRNMTKDKTLEDDLKGLIDPATKGNPMRLLLYISKSLRHLSDALQKEGHKASHTLIRQILEEKGYSMQGNKKDNEGWAHPDRDAQFENINETAKRFINIGEPVISVDTKKKELVGDFKNNGREWSPKGAPEIVKVHDFPDKNLGKVAPYGIYDLARNEGMVNVGIDHDTAQFAVESIRQWWRYLGKKRYPKAKKIYITADGGGSNSYRVRLWKVELQKLADETGLEVNVSHFPPGLSKWNKIEHKLFCYISENWRAKPLRDHATIINLIASTTNKTGLKVYARLDTRKYATKIKVSNEEFNLVNIRTADFHGEWNYAISPRKIA